MVVQSAESHLALCQSIVWLYCVGVPGVQPPEYTGGHRQHGCHCKAVGCGDWG